MRPVDGAKVRLDRFGRPAGLQTSQNYETKDVYELLSSESAGSGREDFGQQPGIAI